MAVLTLSLGDYEKQVLLELDKELSWSTVQWMRVKDPRLIVIDCIVSDCYDAGVSIVQCINLIYQAYELYMFECVLDSIAVLSNN